MRRSQRYAIVGLGLALVVGALAGLKACQIATVIAAAKQAEKAGPPPESVATFVAREQTWEKTIESVGSVAAARGVSINNDAPGIVRRIEFESGASVRPRQPLVELDSRVERAQLKEAIAKRDLAATTVKRSQALLHKGAISPAQDDSDEEQLSAATAEVESLNAQIDRKIVRAPFAGKLGIRLVNVGQYLPSGTSIAILESEESTYVDFELPQRDLGSVEIGTVVRMSVDGGEPGQRGRRSEGTVVAVDPALDLTTRNIKVRALAPRSPWLRPGMFVDVTVVEPRTETTVVVPSTAVVHASYGDSVFVVEDERNAAGRPVLGPDGKPSKIARQQFVRPGTTRGDFVAIQEGLKSGQDVVVGGAFKLKNRARVRVNNSVQPKPELAPRPPNR
jgi:membrane fusion protein (multidrug efflux system)